MIGVATKRDQSNDFDVGDGGLVEGVPIFYLFLPCAVLLTSVARARMYRVAAC